MKRFFITTYLIIGAAFMVVVNWFKLKFIRSKEWLN